MPVSEHHWRAAATSGKASRRPAACRVTIWLSGLAAALLLFGLLVVTSPSAAAAAANPDLTLSPSSGPPGTTFAVTFTFVGAQCPSLVTFSWDSPAYPLPPALVRTCTGTIRATPPAADSAPGAHTVIADYSFPSGASGQATATFTVLAQSAPTPTPTAAPTRKPQPTAVPAPTATPAALPPPATASAAAPETATPTAVVTPPATAAPIPAAAPPTVAARTDVPWSTLVIPGGCALMLAVALGLGWRTRPGAPLITRREMFAYPSTPPSGGSPFLARLNDDELAAVLRNSHARQFNPGELLQSKGDLSRELFIVTDGSFNSTAADGSPFTLGAGSLAGQLSFFDGAAAPADIVAGDSAAALVINRTDMDRLRLQHPRVAHLLVMDLGRAVTGEVRTS